MPMLLGVQSSSGLHKKKAHARMETGHLYRDAYDTGGHQRPRIDRKRIYTGAKLGMALIALLLRHCICGIQNQLPLRLSFWAK